MKVFLYEWITGGGLVEESGRLPVSLLAEGSAMIAALAADFAAIGGCQVTTFRDMRLHEPSLPGCDVIEIHSVAERRAELERTAKAADWSLVVAPELDGILLRTVEQLEQAGGRSLNATPEFIAISSDKHRTAERLHQAGINTPPGRVLDADEEKLPADFDYPGVLKPLDGAGSQHTLLVHGAKDEPPPYPWPRRLERYCEGRAASVAFLCGDGQYAPLPPCWQHQSSDGRFTYLGGSTIVEQELAERAKRLALSALQAMPPARGYIGVDLVLGHADDGREDFAIEINPRVTTSYVGLRRAVQQNLAESILDVVRGIPVELTSRGAVEFTANGQVTSVN
jgi:predicted ATP-grasp superfamily ATP-dependent carboligase